MKIPSDKSVAQAKTLKLVPWGWKAALWLSVVFDHIININVRQAYTVNFVLAPALFAACKAVMLILFGLVFFQNPIRSLNTLRMSNQFFISNGDRLRNFVVGLLSAWFVSAGVWSLVLTASLLIPGQVVAVDPIQSVYEPLVSSVQFDDQTLKFRMFYFTVESIIYGLIGTGLLFIAQRVFKISVGPRTLSQGTNWYYVLLVYSIASGLLAVLVRY